MLKPCLLLATLGLTVFATGCGPEELVTAAATTTPAPTEPCAGTPEACAELERQKRAATFPTEPCGGTPEACAELERQKRAAAFPTEPCGGTLEACAGLGYR